VALRSPKWDQSLLARFVSLSPSSASPGAGVESNILRASRTALESTSTFLFPLADPSLSAAWIATVAGEAGRSGPAGPCPPDDPVAGPFRVGMSGSSAPAHFVRRATTSASSAREANLLLGCLFGPHGVVIVIVVVVASSLRAVNG
jgi:hypothetical protein